MNGASAQCQPHRHAYRFRLQFILFRVDVVEQLRVAYDNNRQWNKVIQRHRVNTKVVLQVFVALQNALPLIVMTIGHIVMIEERRGEQAGNYEYEKVSFQFRREFHHN